MKDVKEIIGIQRVDFTPQGQSNPILGYKMFFLEDSDSPSFIGKRCASYWVPDRLKSGAFTVGKYEFDIRIYNGKASVQSVTKL